MGLCANAGPERYDKHAMAINHGNSPARLLMAWLAAFEFPSFRGLNRSVVLLILLLGLAPSSLAVPAPKKYVVQKNDTLTTIAHRHGVSLGALMQSNKGLSQPNQIYTGQVLWIPGIASASKAPRS